ncbi:hypothetical protein F2Q70_00033665 [Brassica cretica]|uniref:Uncharacterized protein n=1 Tax=Brassica cretica TaxID=69181 RepID=A0A8S9JTL8_BRACR|nr:hypothetical protein F2Q70_00033665 [Brassica cretica]
MSNCDRLKPVLYTDKSYVIRERDPVGEMLFVTRVNLISATTNGGRTWFLPRCRASQGKVPSVLLDKVTMLTWSWAFEIRGAFEIKRIFEIRGAFEIIRYLRLE